MENKEIKKLFRSLNDKWIAGVCGGLAEYLNIDSTVVRLLFILLLLVGGSGILFYLIAWILIPVNPSQTEKETKDDKSKIWGIILLIIGIFLLLKNLDLIPFVEFWEWFDFVSWGVLISVVLIIIGFYLIVRKVSTSPTDEKINPQVEIGISQEQEIPRKKKYLHKSRKDKKLSGVCAGIAEYLEIDVTIVRLIFVLITLSSFGLGIFLYIILAIVMPQEKDNI